MPELPDVAAHKNYLDSTALHKTIQSTSVREPRILFEVSRQKLASALKRSELNSSTRHGKFLFARLSEGGWLLLHFGMSGNLSYYEKDSREPEYACVVLHFANGGHLAVMNKRMLGRGGDVEDKDAVMRGEDLGPDALDISLETFLEKIRWRKGSIKPALMHQSVLAGVGNVYADEALFQAGVHPAVPCKRLSEDALKTLHRCLRRVLRTAVRHLARIEELPDGYLLPQRGEDEPCPRCGNPIRQITVSGRTTYLCNHCQKKKR